MKGGGAENLSNFFMKASLNWPRNVVLLHVPYSCLTCNIILYAVKSDSGKKRQGDRQTEGESYRIVNMIPTGKSLLHGLEYVYKQNISFWRASKICCGSSAPAS